MFALDAATGCDQLELPGAGRTGARVSPPRAPAVSGDVVVAPFASGEVVALRTTNGAVLWMDTLSFTNRNNALSEIRDIPGRPVIYRGDVFAGSHSGVFGAITLRDGQRRWDLPITTITTPGRAGDVVYVRRPDGRGDVHRAARAARSTGRSPLNAPPPRQARQEAREGQEEGPGGLVRRDPGLQPAGAGQLQGRGDDAEPQDRRDTKAN